MQGVKTGFCRKKSVQTGSSETLIGRDGGYEQQISNGGRFKPAFAERDKKQTMIDSSEETRQTGLKNQLYPSTRLTIGSGDLEKSLTVMLSLYGTKSVSTSNILKFVCR
jgi:hypothetical protein